MPTPLDNRIPPPVLALAIGVVMGSASFALDQRTLPGAVRIGAAVAALIVAGVFGARAFAAFGKAGTTINPVRIDQASALVMTGVYGFSRNPMYVSLTALLVALAMALGNPSLLLGPLLFALYIDRFQIVPEERAMRKKFGAAFEAYKQRVRRWL